MNSSHINIRIFILLISTLSFSKFLNAEPNFEFYNKRNVAKGIKIGDVAITISNAKDSKFRNEAQHVDSGEKLQADIDFNKDTIIKFYENIGSTGIMSSNKVVGEYKVKASPGKTCYVSFITSKEPYMYPQTGPLKGWTGKTESGLNLKNNIKQEDIKQVQKFVDPRKSK